MRLELDDLRGYHPILPAARARDLEQNAAHALQRRYRPGVVLAVVADHEQSVATLQWRPRASAEAEQLDANRVTEDGAEAIALALVHALKGWTILRRLNRRERGDWLLGRADGMARVVLEVSGTDDGSAEQRLREKLAQVAAAAADFTRVACVVRFEEPRALLQQVRE